MMRFAAALAAATIAAASPAAAACPADSHFLTCTLKGGAKKLEVCHQETRASYWFGSAGGKAELALTARAGEFEHTPWSGVGKNIWESILFNNNGVDYEVYGTLERVYPADDSQPIRVVTHGGVIVSKNGDELAHLRCDAGKARFSW